MQREITNYMYSIEASLDEMIDIASTNHFHDTVFHARDTSLGIPLVTRHQGVKVP
jgi:hypothetical protein